MSDVRVYPTVAIRQLVEEALREDKPAAAKIRELEVLGDQLRSIQGTITQYIGSLDKREEAARFSFDKAVVEARENADIREEMIRRGLATEAEMDERGYRSHDELDKLEADGSLEQELQEGVLGWGLALLRGTAFEQAIRRNRRTGQFMDLPGNAPSSPGISAPEVRTSLRGERAPGLPNPDIPSPRPTRVRGSVRQPAPSKRRVPAPRGGREVRSYYAPERGGELEDLLAKYSAMSDADRDRMIHPALTREGHDDMRELATGRAPGDTQRLPLADLEAELDEFDRGVHPHQSEMIRYDLEKLLPHTNEARRQAAYDRRKKELDKALVKLEREGIADATEAELHFNAAEHVSQHTLLRYAREGVTTPTTVDLHSSVGPDGRRMWDADRSELHAAIIDLMLRQRKEVRDPENPGKTKMVLCAECDYYPDAGDMRTVLFSGGGYSAGKGGIIKKLAKEGRVPPDALKIDPDEIKALLPEFDETLEGDPEANLRVYEEAWEISQELQRQAQRIGMNVIVDGITNTSKEEVEARLLSFIKPEEGKGGKTYVDPQIIYVDIPTEEAISRAAHRAENAEAASDRRFIPETIIRAVHRDVAATIPGVTEIAQKHGARMEVWNNNQGTFGDGSHRYPDEEIPEGKEGKFRPPVRIFQSGPGQYEIQDQEEFDALLNKAHETIPGVDDPETTSSRAERTKRYIRQRLDWMGLAPPEKGDVATETLGTFEDTFDKWSVRLPDGSYLWDPTREAEHERIINNVLTDGEGNPLPRPPTNERIAVFTAGIPASGKSSKVPDLWQRLTGSPIGEDPEVTPAHIDPDAMRAELPEIREMIDNGDRYSGRGSQREARYLADQAYERAIQQGNNVIAEGTGGGEPGVFHDKIRAAQANGHTPYVLVTELPPDEAKRRSDIRSESDKRVTSHATIDRYADEVPARFGEWSQDSTIGWELYSNDVPMGTDPVPIARRSPNGQIEFVDEESYRNWLQRARWARERGNAMPQM